MKQILLSSVVCVLLLSSLASASNEIYLDVTQAGIETSNNGILTLRDIQVSASGLTGKYWATFQWDAVNYAFYPIDYGSQNDESAKTKTEQLMGQWFFTEKMIIPFAAEINFNVLSPNLLADGSTVILGKNSSGYGVAGGYNITLSQWMVISLNSSSATFDDSFVFTTNGNKVTTGCYYLVYKSDGHFSNCYPLYGFKNSRTPVLSKAILSSEQSYQAQLFKETILQDEIETEKADSNIAATFQEIKSLLK